jgi:hypothetical protein
MENTMNKFPLLIIPIVLYNLIVGGLMISGSAVSESGANLAEPWFSLPMPTLHATWTVSVGDLVVLVGLSCLFLEILKSTRTSDSSIINHAMGMLVMIVAIVEFLLVPACATSTFFLLTVMCGLDVLAGFIVTTIGARKDIGA